MKTLLLVCLCLFVSEAFGSALPLAMQFLSECKQEEGLASNELMDARLEDGENASEHMKCFYKCILEKSHIIDGNDFSPVFKLGLDLALDNYNPNAPIKQLLESFKACLVTTGTDSCDLAYNFVKCIKPKVSQSLFL